MREPRVASVMTSPVITTKPGTPFKDVVTLLTSNGISAVPVVSDDGRPLGVVSEADTLAKQEFHGGADPLSWLMSRRRRTRWRKASGVTAADLMTYPVVTIGEQELLTAAARRLADKRVRRLFVVDADERIIGVVSRHDIIGTFLRSDKEIKTAIEEDVLRHGMWVFPGTVEVSVTNGLATLTGTLEHRSAVDVAGLLTHAVAGVVGVHNNLHFIIDDSATVGI
jgi:CBS domain-containing protein